MTDALLSFGHIDYSEYDRTKQYTSLVFKVPKTPKHLEKHVLKILKTHIPTKESLQLISPGMFT